MKLGEFLLQKKLITQFQLESALQDQRSFGHKLGDILIERGFISEGELLETIAEWKNIKFVDLSELTPSQTALKILTGKYCKDHLIYPIRLKEENGRKTLFIALTDAFNLDLLDQIKFHANVSKIEPILAAARAIDACIQRDYEGISMGVLPLNYTKKQEQVSFDEFKKQDIDEDMIESDDIYDMASKVSSAGGDTTTNQIINTLKSEVNDLKEKLEAHKKITNALIKILIKKGITTKEEYYEYLK